MKRGNFLLLVVDFQETLFRKCVDREEVERKAVFLIRCLRELGVPVIVTEQYPKGLGPTSEGIADALGEFDAMSKTRFSCLEDDGIRERVAATGQKDIILCGIEAHICVYQTARDLLESGSRVHVAADAVSSRGARDMEVATGRMREEGARIVTAEMIVYDLLGGAGTEEFKRLLPLLK
jgi:nicotinamidase-related amidase